MGRKPNQLILEFFERGPKLEDASNRYQHTCKSCGEKFPKGRIDSLTNHLVKKCPALPVRDRQRAILQFHELPDLPDNVVHMAQAGQSHNTMSLPFAPKQQMSALETLAEVSRQHLDLSGKRVVGMQRRKTPPPPPNNTTTFGSLDEFIIHDDRPDGLDSITGSQGMDSGNAPALPSIYQFNGPLQHSPTGSPHLGSLSIPNSGSMQQMIPSNLVMAASAANELQNSMMPLTNGLTMEPELNMSNTGISDKFFHNQGRQQWQNVSNGPIDPMLHDHMRDQFSVKDDSLNKSLSHPRPIAMNPHGTQTHFTTDFSMNQKPAKPKVRGRFSDSRRKEVQEVRKRGACIRCRMLKKPCSGESPCSTCVNVESARLWKQPCIRTRIAEEFNLYSAGLHGVLAFHAISQAKGQIRLDQIPGRIEATHHPETGTFATFTPLKCQSQAIQTAEIDPAILASLSPSTLEIIDSDNDDIGGRLDLYVKKLTSAFYESEDSPFMKTTLGIAFSIISPNQDGLLSRVLELWIYTRILTSRDLDWHIFSNPSLAPALAPATMTPSDLESGHRTPITPVNNPSSYDLIKMQLMGALEKRAGGLGRVVMNDLERRLLQRQQANPFETFLVAVVLLACVERMCWLFRTWEDDGAQNQHQNSDANPQPNHHEDNGESTAPSSPHPHPEPPTDASSQPHTYARHPKWPFDRPPAYYSQQGERFSDIMYMLLKMRGVPPKPVPRSEDGMLVVWGDDTDEKVREWYEGIKVSVETLNERANARFEGVSPREWELRWVGKIVRG